MHHVWYCKLGKNVYSNAYWLTIRCYVHAAWNYSVYRCMYAAWHTLDTGYTVDCILRVNTV